MSGLPTRLERWSGRRPEPLRLAGRGPAARPGVYRGRRRVSRVFIPRPWP